MGCRPCWAKSLLTTCFARLAGRSPARPRSTPPGPARRGPGPGPARPSSVPLGLARPRSAWPWRPRGESQGGDPRRQMFPGVASKVFGRTSTVSSVACPGGRAPEDILDVQPKMLLLDLSGTWDLSFETPLSLRWGKHPCPRYRCLRKKQPSEEICSALINPPAPPNFNVAWT